MTTRVRQIMVPPELRAKLENAAFVANSNMSALLSQLVTDYTGGKLKLKVDLDKPEADDEEANMIRLGFVIEDELWEDLKRSSWLKRTTRSRLARELIRQKFGHMPVDRGQALQA